MITISFNKESSNWNNSKEWNMLFLETTKDYFNDLIKYRGYLYLRDVYEYLSIPCNLDAIRERKLNSILWCQGSKFDFRFIKSTDDEIVLELLNYIID